MRILFCLSDVYDNPSTGTTVILKSDIVFQLTLAGSFYVYKDRGYFDAYEDAIKQQYIGHRPNILGLKQSKFLKKVITHHVRGGLELAQDEKLAIGYALKHSMYYPLHKVNLNSVRRQWILYKDYEKQKRVT